MRCCVVLGSESICMVADMWSYCGYYHMAGRIVHIWLVHGGNFWSHDRIVGSYSSVVEEVRKVVLFPLILL